MFCLCDGCTMKCHEVRDCSKCGCFDECMERTPDKENSDADID